MSPGQQLVISDFDQASGVGHLRLNRPEVLNALDVPLARGFRDAVLDMTGRPGVRCLVISAEGRGFVAGGDVASMAAEPDRAADVVNDLLDALHPAILALRDCDAPCVAAVRGVAAGAGLSLMLGADLVVADEKARFVLAYDKVGAAPDCGGTWFLPRRVGRAMAMEMMLLGRVLDASAALACGLVNEVLPADRVDARALELAAEIAAGPTRAFGAFRRLLDEAHAAPLAQHLEAERQAFVAATATEDFRAGVAAFVARTRPVFGGR